MRKSITALTPAELMSLRKGVAVMMSRNTASRDSADFRRSWVYWANMHGHFGDDCRGPIVGNGMSGLQLWIASNPSEAATWCTCEHGTSQFLTWHRMYLYFFERVLQQAANDPTLTLPYWDYATDREAAAGLARQDLRQRKWRRPCRTRSGSKRGARRSTPARRGLPRPPPPRLTRCWPRRAPQFEKRIEATPHGAVHCAIPEADARTG